MPGTREVEYDKYILTQRFTDGMWKTWGCRLKSADPAEPKDMRPIKLESEMDAGIISDKMRRDMEELADIQSMPMSEHHTTQASGSHNEHARLAPSAAEQWSNCTASIGFIESVRHRLPEDDSSEYSKEGTQAHDYAADLFNDVIKLSDIPDNFRPHVASYVDHCLALGPENAIRYIEAKVPLFYMRNKRGTVDFSAVTETRIWTRDLKYGQGVLVLSEENKQLAIYTLSLVRELQEDGIFDFSPDTIIDIMAVMPRHREAEDAKPWILTLKELEDFCAEHITPAAEAILRSLGEEQECDESGAYVPPEYLAFAPGEYACRWCPARAICGARASAIAEAFDGPDSAGIDFLALLPDLSKELKDETPLNRLSETLAVADGIAQRDTALADQQIVAFYAAAKGIKAFLSDVEEYLQARADAGIPAPGTKLVMGREGNRAWNDIEAVDTLLTPKLKADRYTKELVSPAQAEKLLKEAGAELKSQSTKFQNRFNSLISRSPAKAVIALASDKREAVSSKVDLLPDIPAAVELDEDDGV